MRPLFFLEGFFREAFLFCDQKRSRKVPLLPGRGARPRGPAPWEPQRCGREVKKLKNAGVLRFSSRFFTSLHIDPSGAKIYSTTHSVGADARCCGVAQRSMPQWGIEPHEWASFAGWRPSFWPPNADAPGNLAIIATLLSFVGADSISARAISRCHQIPRANTVRPYAPLPIGTVGRGLDPSGAKINSMRVELKAPLCKGSGQP